MQADSIKIESDEDGFHLVVDVEDTRDDPPLRYDFNIHNCAEALHEQVNLIIGGWLAEGESVRRDFGDTRLPPYDPREAYPAESSKHPESHSVHADHYDSREGK